MFLKLRKDLALSQRTVSPQHCNKYAPRAFNLFLNPRTYSTSQPQTNLLRESLKHFKKEEFEEVVSKLSRYLSQDPKNTEAWMTKGQAHARLQQYDLALESFDQCLQPPEQPCQPQALMEKAKVYADLGHYEEAVLMVDRILEMDTRKKEVWNFKGLVLMKMGDRHTEAVECFESCLGLDLKQSGVWTNKGTAYLEMGKYSQALEAFNLSLEVDPKSKEAWMKKGLCLFGLNNSKDDVILCLDKSTELDPLYYEAWEHKGSCFWHFEEYEKALECFNKALQINPQSSEGWIGKAQALSILEPESEQALICYQNAIQLDSNNANAHFNKGVLLSSLRRYEEAIVAFNQALELQPHNAALHFSKSYAQLHLQDYKSAFGTVQRGLSANPKDARGWFYRALILNAIRHEQNSQYNSFLEENNMDQEEILQNFKVAVDLDPENVLYLVHLSNEWKQKGDEQKHLQYLLKAQLIHPQLVQQLTDNQISLPN